MQVDGFVKYGVAVTHEFGGRDGVTLEPVLMTQVHGSVCQSIESADANVVDADALITDKVGVCVGVRTADCVPVLFYGSKGDGSPVVAAAHAGWRGALDGVLENTVAAFADFGCEISKLRAVIGPCIRQGLYEVDLAFAEPFCARDDAAERFFMAGADEGKLQFDLAGYCMWRLSLAGMKSVLDCGADTYEDDGYFSFRRGAHAGVEETGRQVSSVTIVPPSV